MKKILSLFLMALWVSPVWAGSEVIVRLESTSDKNAWVNLDAFVQDGRLKVNFWGPWSRGALIYNQKTSAITIEDDTNKINVPVSQADQNAFKMMSYLGAGRIKGLVDKSDESVRLAYQLAEQNARALFNGSAVLTKKNVRMGGFNCSLYESREGSVLNRQEWIAPRKATGITSDEYDTLWSLARQMVDLLGYTMTQLGADTDSFLHSYSNLEFPVHVALYSAGKISSRFKVVKILHRVLKNGDFEPPVGYRTMSLPDIMEQGIRGH